MELNIISHTSEKSDSVERLTNELELNNKRKPQEIHYGIAVDKLTQYKFYQEKGIPALPWTTDPREAQKWLDAGETVMARTRIKGQTGKGIVVVKPGDKLPEAKVYTKYLTHKREFRVNLFKGQVVNFREKLKMIGSEGDFHIRNRGNGYTTAHPKPLEAHMREALYRMAQQAAAVSPSDIVGVDVGYNVDRQSLFVIEVNGGPSIEGSTVREMATAIKNHFAQEHQ